MADVLVERPSAFATTFGWTVVPGYLDFPEVLPALRDALPAGDPPRYAGHPSCSRDRPRRGGPGVALRPDPGSTRRRRASTHTTGIFRGRSRGGDGVTRADIEWGTTPKLLAHAAATRGEATAIHDGDVVVSWAELERVARRAAAATSTPGSDPATGWRSGRRTSGSGSPPRSASISRAACSCRSTRATRASRPRTSSVGAARASS